MRENQQRGFSKVAAGGEMPQPRPPAAWPFSRAGPCSFGSFFKSMQRNRIQSMSNTSPCVAPFHLLMENAISSLNPLIAGTQGLTVTCQG